MNKMFYKLALIPICMLGVFLAAGITAEAGSYYKRLGDIHRDGAVNASDALLVLKKAASQEELDENQAEVADVNKDGTINAEDALQILKVAARIDAFRVEVDLPAGEEYIIDNVHDSGAFIWRYEVEPADGISVERQFMPMPDGAVPGDTAEQVYTIVAEKPGTYELTLKLNYVADAQSEPSEKIIYVFHVSDPDIPTDKTEVELSVGQEYVIDNIYDIGSSIWRYEVEPADGISVERHYMPMPDDAVPGDMAEQVYTIVAEKPGTYKLTLKLNHVADAQSEPSKKIVYVFHVSDPDIPTDKTGTE